jgi:hypothetical protein
MPRLPGSAAARLRRATAWLALGALLAALVAVSAAPVAAAPGSQAPGAPGEAAT